MIYVQRISHGFDIERKTFPPENVLTNLAVLATDETVGARTDSRASSDDCAMAANFG